MIVHVEFKEGYNYYFRKELYLESLQECCATIDIELYKDDNPLMWSNICKDMLIDTSNPLKAFYANEEYTFYIQPEWCEAIEKPNN